MWFRSFCLFTLCLNHLIAQEQPQVLIIGSGPAGLGAACITAQKGYSTLVCTGPTPRGQLNYERPVKNFLGMPQTPGKIIMERLEQHAELARASIVPEEVTYVAQDMDRFFIMTSSGREFTPEAVIIATGTGAKKLNVYGEREAAGRGLNYELNKDDISWHGKDVVVIGGGEDAVQNAKRLAVKASSVQVLVRGDDCKASHADVHALQAMPNVTISFNTAVKGVISDSESVIAVLTDSGVIRCDQIFVSIGLTPNSDLVKEFVECDKDGYIVLIGRTQTTSCPGLFAAGTVADPIYSESFISAAQGMMAAYDTCKYLKAKKIKPKMK